DRIFVQLVFRRAEGGHVAATRVVAERAAPARVLPAEEHAGAGAAAVPCLSRLDAALDAAAAEAEARVAAEAGRLLPARAERPALSAAEQVRPAPVRGRRHDGDGLGAGRLGGHGRGHAEHARVAHTQRALRLCPLLALSFRVLLALG
ncbi:unnamed protein product, partial [Ectocarpus sp. 13 AM-2016]